MTTKLTREWLQDRIANMECYGVVGDEALILQAYRMALAAMDSEPVAEVLSRRPGNDTSTIDRALPVGTQLYRHAQPAPVVPEGLNPETTDLVLRFASALADKLYKAEQKYGRSTDWMKDDWYDDCLQSLWEHIEKGDPRDVAAYCAFMWYHGWVTTDYDRNVQNACRAAMLQESQKSAGESNNCRSNENVQVLQAGNSPAHSVLRPEQISGSPAQDGNSPVIPDGYVMVPKEPTKEMIDAGWLYFMGTKNPSSKGAYKAMLAAAPQEAK